MLEDFDGLFEILLRCLIFGWDLGDFAVIWDFFGGFWTCCWEFRKILKIKETQRKTMKNNDK